MLQNTLVHLYTLIHKRTIVILAKAYYVHLRGIFNYLKPTYLFKLDIFNTESQVSLFPSIFSNTM